MMSEKDWYEHIGFEIEVLKTAPCRANHKVGQKFIIDDFTTPKGLCLESLHGMYPLLFASRIRGDFKQLGSDTAGVRIYTCPSRVVQFEIKRFHQCNNCGKKVSEEDLKSIEKEYEAFKMEILACHRCFSKLKNK